MFHNEDPKDRPPNAQLLSHVIDPGALPDDPLFLDETELEFDITDSPFSEINEFELPLNTEADVPLGLKFNKCDRLLRAYVSTINSPPIDQKIRAFRRTHLGAYVVSLNNEPVFTLDDINRIVGALCDADNPPKTVQIELAPERKSLLDDRETPLHLRLHDLRRIAALCAVDGEGLTPEQMHSEVRRCEDAMDVDAIAGGVVEFVVNRLQTTSMTEEECQLKSFTRRNLMRLSNWSDWDAAFDEQLKTTGKLAPSAKQSRVHVVSYLARIIISCAFSGATL
jgi:hypothetical protein